jgi:hypothetical protein
MCTQKKKYTASEAARVGGGVGGGVALGQCNVYQGADMPGGGGGEVDDEQTMTVIMAPTVVVVVHGLLALIEYIHILLYIYIYSCV